MPATNDMVVHTKDGPVEKGGDNVNVFVFMKSHKVGEHTIDRLVQTSIFLDEEEERGYWLSEGKRVVNGVLAIPQGAYRLRFMEEMALRRGLHFRAVTYATRDLKHFNYQQYVTSSTLTFSTAERCTFMSILKTNHKFFNKADVITEFGGRAMGVGLKYVKKLMKRTQEFLRSSHMTMFIKRAEDTVWTTTGALPLMAAATGLPINELFSDNKLVVAKFIRPEGAPMELYDGINMIDMEVVIGCLREQLAVVRDHGVRRQIRQQIRDLYRDAETLPIVGRYIFRLAGFKGLLKGDCFAVVGLKKRTGADVIYDQENLKDEIWTLNGETNIALENHEAIHDDPKWDTQSTTDFRYGLSAIQQANDIVSMRTRLEEVIDTREIPKWMLVEHGVPNMAGYKMASTKKLAEADFHRVQRYGIDVLSAQNFGQVMLGGEVAKLEVFLNRETGFNKKPFIPLSYAISAGVMTYRAIEDMAGIDLSHLDQTKVNLMVNVGALFPTDRWLATIGLHGGEDLDDTNNLHYRRMYCSDADHLANLVRDGVIGDIAVPTTPEEAIELVLVIRSPNGAGEYSIEEMVMKLDDPNLPLLDLAKMPRGSNHLAKMGQQTEIITDPNIVYGGNYTRDNAMYVVTSQADNPGIGPVANMLMVWHDAVGSTLPVGIPALEDMVDTVQQTHDQVAINQVREVPALIGQQLADVLEADPTKRVDLLLVTERLRYTQGEFMEVIRSRVARRRPTETNTLYRSAVQSIRDLIKSRLLQERAATPLYKAVMAMRLPQGDMEFAANHVEDMRHQFTAIAKRFQTGPYDSHFKKVFYRNAETEAVRAVVEEKVAMLKADPRMKYRIVAMYKYCVQPQVRGHQTWKLGYWDQVIFRSAGAEVALFDLLGQVVRDNKLIK